MDSGSRTTEIKPVPPSGKSTSSRFGRQRQSFKGKPDEVISTERKPSRREGVADIEPKVFEPYILIPGRTPRKVAVERKRKLYSSVSIEKLLKEEGIDYNKPIAA